MKLLNKLKDSKVVAGILSLAILVIVGQTTTRYPLVERAIAVGVAIDKVADDIVVSAQILSSVSQGADNSSDNSFVVVKGVGHDVCEALFEVNNLNGLYLSMGQCLVIFVGEDFAHDKSATYEAINHLSKNYKLPESTLVAVTKGNAGELISNQTITTGLLSFGVKQMNDDMEKTCRVVVRDVIDYKQDYISPASTVCLQYVQAEDTFSSPASGGAGAETGGTIIDIQSAYVVGAEDEYMVLDKYQVEAINLLTKDYDSGHIGIIDYELEYNNKKVSISPHIDDMSVNIDIEVSALKYRYYAGYNESEDKEQMQIQCEQQVGAKVLEVFETTKVKYVDAYQLYKEFYRKYGKRFRDNYTVQDMLDEINIEVQVHFTIED